MAVACGVALALTLTACGKATAARGKDKADSARPVQVVPVQKVDVRRVIEVVGTLAADEQVTVMAEAEGRVARLLVDMGDRVKAGQPIIELDREKAQYRYEASKAALERALAKYGVAEGS
jgi:multidrug efflux pump subunit AcrA (membrane-fusion protein)